MSRDIAIKSFPIRIIFEKNQFFFYFLGVLCPYNYAKVEKLILLFSNLLGHTFNVFQTQR